MRVLFLLFIIIPITEMWLLIKVGERIGASSTILLVFLTAVIGVALLKRQGLNTLLRANQRMEQGELPAKELLDGFCLAVGGALLLTPGFLTDAFGFACLLPLTRSLIVKGFMRNSFVQMSSTAHQTGQDSFHASHFSEETSQTSSPQRSVEGDVLEGDFEREDKD